MNKTKKLEKSIVLLALAILVVTEFFAHRFVPFMMDDLWYGTNLVNGEALRNFRDVAESMIWHFYNWGGRCMTHGALQLTLMSGEFCADIINMAATLLMTFLVCLIIRRKDVSVFLLVHAMLFALNANVKMSMLWQSGTANYVYSSVWMLVFLWPYLRFLREPESEPLPWACFWLFPMGVLAGWSNENIGPSCFLTAAGITIYLWHRQKRRPAGWMFVGVVSSLIGSVLVVAAPGNFVRSEFVAEQSLFDRFYAMLTAGTDFLLPSVLPMILLLLLKGVCLRKRIADWQWALLVTAVLSYGAMVLSPHYPDRATFGTMVLCIVVTVSVLLEVKEEKPQMAPCVGVVTACFWLSAVGRLLLEISFVR